MDGPTVFPGLDPAHLARTHIDEFDSSDKRALGANENGAAGEGDGWGGQSLHGKRDKKNGGGGKNLDESAATSQGGLLKRKTVQPAQRLGSREQ